MHHCQEHDPEDRPSFSAIRQSLCRERLKTRNERLMTLRSNKDDWNHQETENAAKSVCSGADSGRNWGQKELYCSKDWQQLMHVCMCSCIHVYFTIHIMCLFFMHSVHKAEIIIINCINSWTTPPAGICNRCTKPLTPVTDWCDLLIYMLELLGKQCVVPCWVVCTGNHRTKVASLGGVASTVYKQHRETAKVDSINYCLPCLCYIKLMYNTMIQNTDSYMVV